MSKRSPKFPILEMDAEHAFFSGKLKGFVTLCHENERPLRGFAGYLDWKFHGALSKYIRTGVISGKAGECIYLPLKKQDRTYHILLVGGGRKKRAKESIPQASLTQLKKNLQSLKLTHVGISRQEFGDSLESEFESFSTGGALWIVH